MATFNGFMLEKLYHPPILITISWLPWLIFFQTKFFSARAENRAHSGLWFFLAALAFALQLLAGFPQMALLSAFVFFACGIVGVQSGPGFLSRANMLQII